MVCRNLCIAIVLAGLVAAVTIRPSACKERTDRVRKPVLAATQVDTTSRRQVAERLAAKLAAMFPIVTCNDGPNSMAAREARIGSFFCGYPEALVNSMPPVPRSSVDYEIQRWLDNFESKRFQPNLSIPEDWRGLIDELENSAAEPAERGFVCGYPAQLTFGFHTPKRIDAGLRWCFDCGAWQPCDCPRSTAIPEFRSLIDEESTGGAYRDIQDELARLRAELDALRDAREKMNYGVRANLPAATRDRIVSAFGILIPDSGGWPTVLRYFAKPLPGASLPNAGGEELTVPTDSGDSP